MRRAPTLGRRLRGGCALTTIALLSTFVPAAATGSASAEAAAQLDVSTLSLGGESLAAISVETDVPIAQASVLVPQGYTVSLREAPGSRVGGVFAVVSNADGSPASDFVDGELVVDDPAKYASDPVAQACAPGVHAAVWRTTLAIIGQSLPLTIFLDPGAEAGGPAYVLRMCPLWPPSTSLPTGLTTRSLSFFFEGPISGPADSGVYVWSAAVTPLARGSVVPDPSRTFELRAVVAWPHTLTLRARHDAKAKNVVLSGRLTALGQPEAGAAISFFALVDWDSERSTFFGPVRTNAAGEFSVRRRVEQTTTFSASARFDPRPCTAPTTAPAGCLSETISPPPFGPSVIVRVRRPIDPKLAIRPRDQALARRASLKLSDFPPGWSPIQVADPLRCERFDPKLSDLTVTGDHESPVFVEEFGAAFSRSSVYVTEKEARIAMGRQAQLAAARCIAEEAEGEGYVVNISRLSFAGLGNERRAFRIAASTSDEVEYLDLVWFRQGRTVVHMAFVSVEVPLLIEQSLVAKVAARARNG